jgi:DNA-binding MarR family transcriptional regulator
MNAKKQKQSANLRQRLPQDWRQNHLGRLLGQAMRKFDERVLDLMAHDVQVPLALSNLASRAQVSAAHVHITRHLSTQGSTLRDLAQDAGMTKQAMGAMVDQCQAWGLVQRENGGADRRTKLIRFTPTGLAWLEAFRTAVARVEEEFRHEVGPEVAAVIALGLEVYSFG